MKLNLSMTAAQVDAARKPEVGVESKVYYVAENCQLIGSLTALTATTAEYTSAGGAAIPVAGRDLFCRISSPQALGVGGVMVVTANVILEDDATDTAVATYHLPTYSAAGSLNQFPTGICSDFTPAGVGNSAKKVKSVVSIASVANMTPGNTFEIYTAPNLADFTFIDCTTSKGGEFNLPSIVNIPCGYNGAAYTKLGVSEPKELSIGFRDRGPLEQLNRFNGSQGTIRMDIVKSGVVTSARFLYTGYWVRAMSPRGDGNDVVEAKAESTYENFMIGYPRVA